jgi:hypothetical protein
MPSVKDNELVLAIRMRELCRPPTAWNRSLWSVSAETALREVLEASLVRRDGILSDASLSNLQHTTSVVLGKDPGVGDQKARRYLQTILNGKTVITPGSLAAAGIDQFAKDLETSYLPRWAAFIDPGIADSDLEQCARCVVSHLLNRGHSRRSVADRIRDAVLTPASIITNAGDLIRDLQSLAAQPSLEYQADDACLLIRKIEQRCAGGRNQSCGDQQGKMQEDHAAAHDAAAATVRPSGRRSRRKAHGSTVGQPGEYAQTD